MIQYIFFFILVVAYWPTLTKFTIKIMASAASSFWNDTRLRFLKLIFKNLFLLHTLASVRIPLFVVTATFLWWLTDFCCSNWATGAEVSIPPLVGRTIKRWIGTEFVSVLQTTLYPLTLANECVPNITGFASVSWHFTNNIGVIISWMFVWYKCSADASAEVAVPMIGDWAPWGRRLTFLIFRV